MSVWSWLVFTGATAAARASERPHRSTPGALAGTGKGGACLHTPTQPC
jgi:hypothetical protein